MNPFADDDPERVELGNDKQGRPMWVDLRRELSIGIEDDFNAKMFVAKFDKEKLLNTKPGQEFDPKDIDLDVNMGRLMSSAATLESWIVDWQLYDKRGDEIPFTAAAIRALSKDVGKVLVDRVKALEAANARLGESSGTPAMVT